MRRARFNQTKAAELPLEGKPFKEIRIGLPKEVADGEKRVAGTPESVALLVKKGFRVSVQQGAGKRGRLRLPFTRPSQMLPPNRYSPGLAASFRDDYYTAAGAEVVRCFSKPAFCNF